MTRTVLLHYHLFKNAGTSLDVILKRNFGDAWITREFERRRNKELHAKDLAQWIVKNPEATVFSSHTISAPPPELPGVRVIPLIFLRQPIDRIASAYAFERSQKIERFGPVLARSTTLSGYVQVRILMASDALCRNFQATRLAAMSRLQSPTADPFKPIPNPEMLRLATDTFNKLPFVGVVDSFDESMARLTRLLEKDFPGFEAQSVQANAKREPGLSLEQKLSKIKTDLGEQVYAKVEAANGLDLTLYRMARKRAATTTPTAAATTKTPG